MQVALPCAGTSHALPQPEQFSGSVSRSTQPLPHPSKPELHWKLHWLPLHVATPFVGTGQALPQAPQSLAETARSTQEPLQLVRPPEH